MTTIAATINNSQTAPNIKTEKELNDDILKISMTIQETYPELSKYIGEMPVTISDTVDTETTIKNLKDYSDSLDVLLKKYAKDHNSTIK
jgi:hypothetical protein